MNLMIDLERGTANPPAELLVLLIRTTKSLVERLRAEKPEDADPGMTPVHGLAVRYLLDRADVTTVDLARYLGITKQSASEVVAALERTGVVERAPHPRDGRARVLLLTDDGRARLDAGRARWNAIERQWSDLVGADRLEVVRNALETYLEAETNSR